MLLSPHKAKSLWKKSQKLNLSLPLNRKKAVTSAKVAQKWVNMGDVSVGPLRVAAEQDDVSSKVEKFVGNGNGDTLNDELDWLGTTGNADTTATISSTKVITSEKTDDSAGTVVSKKEETKTVVLKKASVPVIDEVLGNDGTADIPAEKTPVLTLIEDEDVNSVKGNAVVATQSKEPLEEIAKVKPFFAS